ncbi:hypothetical protein FHS31_002687 [Sphingomonas vulcanisoli]|uniref:DUF2169 domain-containing protein n=1 Tax=Sphingomonas vulcanisoli TaxID=1658060 RepID=A0ABX0TX89_9SPHN|nr:hypothetical protein [Sphingomonas vulcanisoli]NIJ09057.1 hypothetical protein [Sphingomonas vulcanisoli]
MPMGNGSKVAAWCYKGSTLFIRTVPLQWALRGVPCECTIESWIMLDGNKIHVRGRLINHRSDLRQFASDEQQELPAVYTTGRLRRVIAYTGDRPFTGDKLTELPTTFPWTTWRATESWSALVDASGWGVGVINPATISFGGGFNGPKKDGQPADAQTGFIRPGQPEVIDHNIVLPYHYTLVLGTVPEIRAEATKQRIADRRPDVRFVSDRQHWTYINARDSGWPIKGSLKVDTTSGTSELVSSPTFFPALAVQSIFVAGAFSGKAGAVRLYWATTVSPMFSVDNLWLFPCSPMARCGPIGSP